MPEPEKVHSNNLLTNISLQYRNRGSIWREVMPVVPVAKRSDKFLVHRKEDAFKVADDAVGPFAKANEIDWATGEDNYSVKDYALASWLTQEAIDNSDSPLRPEIETTEFVNKTLELNQEKRISDIVFNAATYPAGNKVQLSGTARWGQADSDPLNNVMDAVWGCFERANTLVFGVDAWKKFRAEPKIVEAVRAGTRSTGPVREGLVSASEVAELFEVERVLIGEARYNSAAEGQPTPTFVRLWGKHMAALHIMPGVGLKTMAFGKTFVEQDRLAFRNFDNDRGVKGAWKYKVGWNADAKITMSDLGYFIEDAVA